MSKTSSKPARVTPNTKVWTAAAWYRGCDPSEAVVALTERVCRRKIEAAMREMAKRACEDDDDGRSAEDYLDNVRWEGQCYKEPLREAVSARQLEEAAAALEADGVFYPDLP